MFEEVISRIQDPYFPVELLSATLDGLIFGGIIALGAIGVTLLFGILRFANFAQGDIMTAGAFAAFVALNLTGLPLWLCLPFAMIVSAIICVIIDQSIYRRMRESSPIILLIASFGVALILRNLLTIIFGTNNKSYISGIRTPIELFSYNVSYPAFEEGGDPEIFAESIMILPDQIISLLLCFFFVIVLGIFLKYTRIGKAMRAVSDNPSLARITGINTEHIIIWVWAIGGALAGAAGMMLAMETRIHPVIGWNLLLPIFAATILGGIGRPSGAVLGGFIIGISQEVSTLFIPPAYKPAVAFVILVLMLLLRPQGLLRGKA